MTAMLAKAQATDVFGHRNLRFDVPHGATVAFIHGRNGIGKSTILRLIHDVVSPNVVQLMTRQFRSVQLDFDDGSSVTAEKTDDGRLIYRSIDDQPEEQNWDYPIPADALLDASLEDIELALAMARHGRLPPMRSRRLPRAVYQDLASLSALLDSDSLPPSRPVVYVGTDRLRMLTPQLSPGFRPDPDDDSPQHPLDVRRQQLAADMGRAKALYAERAQRLDRSFPHRIIETLNSAPPDLTQLDDQFKGIQKLRQDVQDVGLLDQEDEEQPFDKAAEFMAEHTVANIMGAYLDDVERKLHVLTPTASRLALFRDLANERLDGKQVRMSASEGYVVFDDHSGAMLTSEQLSSGEQHQLYLLSRLIFPERDGTLFLIDEPEISLHVEWQQSLVGDLEKIASVSQSQFVLATHSPVVVGNQYDRLLDLKEF